MARDLWPGNDYVDWVMWDPYPQTRGPGPLSSGRFYNYLTANSDADARLRGQAVGPRRVRLPRHQPERGLRDVRRRRARNPRQHLPEAEGLRRLGQLHLQQPRRPGRLHPGPRARPGRAAALQRLRQRPVPWSARPSPSRPTRCRPPSYASRPTTAPPSTATVDVTGTADRRRSARVRPAAGRRQPRRHRGARARDGNVTFVLEHRRASPTAPTRCGCWARDTSGNTALSEQADGDGAERRRRGAERAAGC